MGALRWLKGDRTVLGERAGGREKTETRRFPLASLVLGVPVYPGTGPDQTDLFSLFSPPLPPQRLSPSTHPIHPATHTPIHPFPAAAATAAAAARDSSIMSGHGGDREPAAAAATKKEARAVSILPYLQRYLPTYLPILLSRRRSGGWVDAVETTFSIFPRLVVSFSSFYFWEFHLAVFPAGGRHGPHTFLLLFLCFPHLSQRKTGCLFWGILSWFFFPLFFFLV
ncbi:hypothetical protein B0T22DRAFT_35718 [Podospora appendiculata]|uniref:Uncharacterized protein n=1 Tax=Podospora appendiculata TaxID=314037 RepID=A0AAE1CG26_9PEZI|nr:hypothetical protein B0T22DRAFT_35718 [Podospora appendiculata]